MRFGVRESVILRPERCVLEYGRRGSVQRVQVVEQDYGDAPRGGSAVLRQVGERVLRQRLSSPRRGLAGFDRENADFLRFPAIQNHEVVLRQICDRAVLVTCDDTYLNQPSGYANRWRLRRVLRRSGNR